MYRFLIFICLTSTLFACSSQQTLIQDSAPAIHPANIEQTPDAIPRIEEKSKGGNPSSYEVFGKTYHVLSSSEGFVQKGIASWYGTKFHGNKTSNGETYDMYAMTAAHKTLPLPSYLEVTNLTTGKKIVVRVNDRGPFHAGRIVDLSYAAAAKLGTLKTGTSVVEIRVINTRKTPLETLAKPPNTLSSSKENTFSYLSEKTRTQLPKKDPIYIQAGAFSVLSNASKFKNTLKAERVGFVSLKVEPKKDTLLYLVHIGPFFELKEAELMRLKLKEKGYNTTLYDNVKK